LQSFSFWTRFGGFSFLDHRDFLQIVAFSEWPESIWPWKILPEDFPRGKHN
jgi:hypothetical protein